MPINCHHIEKSSYRKPRSEQQKEEAKKCPQQQDTCTRTRLILESITDENNIIQKLEDSKLSLRLWVDKQANICPQFVSL